MGIEKKIEWYQVLIIWFKNIQSESKKIIEWEFIVKLIILKS